MNTFFINETYLKNLQKKTTAELIIHMRQRNLLHSVVFCSFCNVPATEYKNTRSSDGIIFRCGNRHCQKKTTTISIRINSFFKNFNQPLITILEVIYCLSTSESLTKIALTKNISNEAVRNIYNKLVIKMKNYFDLNPIRLGGNGIVCQVDETLLSGKRKYNVGSIVSNQTWVFVIVDTSFSPSRGYATVVTDRSASSLIPIIQNICLSGTVIHSDQWRAYRNISQSFMHLTVNHKLNFVDPITGCHTQNVESYNNRLKMKIKKMKGIKKGCIDDYLIEFMWFERHSGNCFESLLELVKIN